MLATIPTLIDGLTGQVIEHDLRGAGPLVYLLHFRAPLGNLANVRAMASHYLGWAADLPSRLTEHATGRGAAITRAAVERGIGWDVVVLGAGDWRLEKQLKALKNSARLCPRCGVAHPGGRLHAPGVQQLPLALEGDPFDMPPPATARADRWEWMVRRSWRGVAPMMTERYEMTGCDIPF